MEGIGIEVSGTDDMIDRILAEQDAELYNEMDTEPLYSGLAGEIISAYTTNKDAKRNSGIEDEIINSLRAYNGEYSPEDLSRIQMEGGSTVYMNITATKCKTCKSWISDILKPANEEPYDIQPSPVPSLPEESIAQIEQSIDEQVQAAQGESAQEGEQAQVQQAQLTIKEMNDLRRDIQKALLEEIDKESRFQLDKMKVLIKDQLVEGDWDRALTDFIHDTSIFPNAFMKGPIVVKKKRLTWVNGQAVPTEDYIFQNKRINPLDIYPSPNATSIHDGNLIEHVRYTDIREILSFKDVPGYHSDAIDRVVESGSTGYTWVDTGIESDKAYNEYRGTEFEANEDVFHGLHFFGPMQVSDIKEWAGNDVDIQCDMLDDSEVVEVEAILVGDEVIKCTINDDPLCRRPYYSASFMERPGSFWGRSLPILMNDIQRMCNACARALSNNMGMSAGPQVQIYVDRLADDGDIEEITPFKIWQLMSDPTGGGGRAIEFYQPTSNAGELLKVYSEFEARADDVTGIPRYAYGNENSAGYGNTASGLSMLLESSSKVIKDVIRNIDEGLIKPRIEMQFYYNLLKNPDLNYTGDINVIPRGSSALTIKGAESLRRNEFLSILQNPTYLEIIGAEGVAEILRVMAKDLGLPSNIIPSALELKNKQKEQQEQMAAQQQAEMQDKQMDQQASLQAASLQVEGQKEMNQLAQQVKVADMQRKGQEKQGDQQIELMKIQQGAETEERKQVAKLKDTSVKEASANNRQAREIMVKNKHGEGL